MFLSDLFEMVSLADPRQKSFLVFASNKSTTSVPTLYVSSVVVAPPNPPPPPNTSDVAAELNSLREALLQTQKQMAAQRSPTR